MSTEPVASTNPEPPATVATFHFLDIGVGGAIGLCLGCLPTALLGLWDKPVGVLITMGVAVAFVVAALFASMSDPDPSPVPGRAGLAAARFLTDWCIRLLLLAYLTVWAHGAYQVYQADMRAKEARTKSLEQQRIDEIRRERGLGPSGS